MNSIATPHLLVVDDEPELRALLKEYFSHHGYQVSVAGDAHAARELMARTPAHLAILDVNMPGEDGLSLARWMRAQHVHTGIIMLTTAAETIDRVVGLEIGTDDYVPKPFDLRELLARVRAVWRRLSMVVEAAETLAGQGGAGPMAAAPAGDAHAAMAPSASHVAAPGRRVRFGRCLLDLDERSLTGEQGEDIPVTAAEFDLLALFARAPNRPLNRDQIMEQAHSRGWDVYDRSIDLRIMRLRRKIERNPDKPEVIKTVRGVGYVFVSTSGQEGGHA
ncbi:MAG: response regulator [Aquabacterium sp.]